MAAKVNYSPDFEKAIEIGRPPNIVSLFPNSKEDHLRIQKAEESKRLFITEYPEVNWG